MLASPDTLTSAYPPVDFVAVETLADRLRWVLSKTGWSQRKLSVEAGLAPGHVGLITSGRVKGRVAGETLSKIARAAGVSIRWLQDGVGEPTDVEAPAAGFRYADHPDWDAAVAAAQRDNPRGPPAWAYHHAGLTARDAPPARITPAIARDAAQLWFDTASDDEVSDAETAWELNEARAAAAAYAASQRKVSGR